MILHDPGNEEKKWEMWAYLSVDESGMEGLCGAPMPPLGIQPLVTMQARQLLYFDKLAQELARASGKTIKRVRFTARETQETFLAL